MSHLLLLHVCVMYHCCLCENAILVVPLLLYVRTLRHQTQRGGSAAEDGWITEGEDTTTQE